MTGSIVVLCGRSFSGKSRLAAWLSGELPGTVVSLDAINAERGLWGGDGIPIEEWVRTNQLARARARSALIAGGTVIIDDTSSPRHLRDGWRELAASFGARIALVHIDPPLPVIMERWAANRVDPTRGDLADEVMTGHLASFEPPTADENPIRVESTTSDPAVLELIKKRLSIIPRE